MSYSTRRWPVAAQTFVVAAAIGITLFGAVLARGL